MSIAKSDQNVLDFLVKLRAQWPKRFENDESEQAWLGMMVDELRVFDEPVLVEAARYLLRKKLRVFPLLAECVDACVEAKKFLEFKTPKLADPKQRPDSAGRFEALAADIMRGSLGRQACREGWGLILQGFVVKKGRQPNDYEVRDLVRASRDFDKIYAELMRGDSVSDDDGTMIRVTLDHLPIFRQLGDKIVTRREALAQQVLGD